MKRKFFNSALLLILSLAFYSSVFADTVAPPCSYIVSPDNGKYVFVMLAVKNDNECLGQGDERREEGKKLRQTYKSSGLYEKNDFAKPLWTVDWYSYEVFISVDGKHLVRTGPWASEGTDEAFSFFSEGKLIKTYRINELIRYISALPHSVSHFEWQKELKLNDSNNSFEVTTIEGGKFSFKLENGEIISQSKPILPTKEGLAEPKFYIENWVIIVGFFTLSPIFLFVIYRKFVRSQS